MSDPVEAARVLEVEWLNGNVTDGAHDRIEAAIRADVVPTGDAGLDVVNAARAYRDWVMGPEVSESEELERWAVLDDALHAYDARLLSSDTGGRG